MAPNRIAIGTAQFGLRYGVANDSGQVSVEQAAQILSCARAAGIDTVDTAIEYGDSESRLGEVGVGGLDVITKLPSVPPGCADIAAWVDQSVRESLRRLRVGRLRAVLLHRPLDILGQHGAALRTALVDLKDRRIIDAVGASVYAPSDLDALWREFRPDIVQIPFNVFDRRLVSSGWLGRLEQAGVTVHVRSVFLQGLLLMPDAMRPPAFRRWQPLWERWREWLSDNAMTPLRAAVGFALAVPGIERVVIGVDSVDQLREILQAAKEPAVEIPPAIACHDALLIDPSRW